MTSIKDKIRGPIPKITKLRLLGVLLFGVLCLSLLANNIQASSKTKTYTVKSSSKPYANKYVSSTTYNKNTKQYYMLRSYLEQMEKNGGGTLVLKKGTYNVTNILYIPSNVTIKLSKGVKLNKSMETGTKKLSASKSLFQLVAPSQAKKKAGATAYKASENVKIIGVGNPRIDLKYAKNVIGVVIGHNSNVTIEGITFQNMNGGNFIKMAASKKVTIATNIFKNHQDSASNNKEAICLAVADAGTKNFSYKWSKNDNTINQDIYIKNNQFSKLERAIGSTKYVTKKYHTNVQILANNISNIDSDAIKILNWSRPKIEQNSISNVAGGLNNKKAVVVAGSIYPTIKNNTFAKVAITIQILPAKNTGKGSEAPISYNAISAENKAGMVKNTVQEVGKYYIIYNKTYNEYNANTSRWYYIDYTTKDYAIEELSLTYRDYFTNYSTYNGYTEDFYVFRSYLEQLERVGGGTLTVKRGTYTITNTLYIPSNVTINFEDGVVINKGTVTGLASLPPAKSMFQLVPPSKSLTRATIGAYDGGHDINIVGSGTVVIDLKSFPESMAFVLGHNKNISIKGITFQNMWSAHFIELNSSNNVTIEACTFQDRIESKTKNKEAINIDNPDATTEGFNQIWAKQDCTPASDIFIRGNLFLRLERAIGTHKYTDAIYHTNIQILNNTILDCDDDAIRVLNWEKPIITGNFISNVGDGLEAMRAVSMSGVINPIVTGNTFQSVARPIQIFPWVNTHKGDQYPPTNNTVTEEEIAAMLNNTLIQVGDPTIRVSRVYGEDLTIRYSYLK